MTTPRKLLIILFILSLFTFPAYADNYYDYSTVYAAQSALNIAGYSCGEPDGDIGVNTRAAITDFRVDHHLGDNTEIDDVLLYALGVSDAPVWFPCFESSDKLFIEDFYLFEDGCVDTIKSGMSGFGATLGAYLGLGNYVQIDEDSYSFALLCTADENSEILATLRVDGDQITLESVQNFQNGDYYLRQNGDTVPYSRTGAAETRSAQSTQTPAPVQNGRDYVLNKNTHKFHYPSCSSADDIKPQNRWDYNGTREEIIAMGYEPCKRCKP